MRGLRKSRDPRKLTKARERASNGHPHSSGRSGRNHALPPSRRIRTPRILRNKRLSKSSLAQIARCPPQCDFAERGSVRCECHNAQNAQEGRKVTTPQFDVGDKVQKGTGFRFPGTIRAVFYTNAGELRYVVEADNEDFAGMLHIYNPKQLIARKD